ncbi:hypothetical protein TKK_0008330 [Trichogramma kaykai]
MDNLVNSRNYNTQAIQTSPQGTLATLDVKPNPRKRKHEQIEEEDDQAHDEVRLWEDGFKDRYCESKFDVLLENIAFGNNVAVHYVRGLYWVLLYY